MDGLYADPLPFPPNGALAVTWHTLRDLMKLTNENETCWYVGIDKHGGLSVCHHGVRIADINDATDITFGPDRQQAEENAVLMAAAPKLLYALEASLRVMPQGTAADLAKKAVRSARRSLV